MALFLLIILALLVYMAWPLIKVLWKAYSFQRKMRSAFYSSPSGNRQGGESRGNPRTQTSGEARDPYTGRRKKIDRSVGEYVEFEEIEVDSEEEIRRQYGSAGVEYRRQQQISDAEWEEVR
ncbi:MAG: DUF4834 family protein [Clostridium sp.]|nr:DUF4834 family protein [Clostridium sp.]